MTQPSPAGPAGVPPTEAALPRSLRPLLALLVLAGAAAIILGYLFVARPVLAFTNRLAAPVRLILGSTVRTVPAGAMVRLPLPRGETAVATWELVRPLSADGEPMGVPVRGSIVTDGKRRVAAAAASRGLDADYFAPLISNSATVPLRVVVNAGLPGALDCGCAVRPGARRVFIGYYPLYRNSTVQARAAGRRPATFRDLGPEVRDSDGTLGLSFREQDFQR